MRTHLLIGLSAAALLMGCGGGGGSGGETVEADIAMGDMFYEPASIEVPSGGRLAVTVTNEGSVQHDLKLDDGTGIDVVPAGGSDSGELGPFTESTVAFCTVPGHREAGMELDVTVTE
jgi:nitrite reductase (NO-forming)